MEKPDNACWTPGVSSVRFSCLIKCTCLEKFGSKFCAIAVQGIEISFCVAVFRMSMITMKIVFVPRRPQCSLGDQTQLRMSNTFYGLHFSKHHRRREGALFAKYSREHIYGFLQRVHSS